MQVYVEFDDFGDPYTVTKDIEFVGKWELEHPLEVDEDTYNRWKKIKEDFDKMHYEIEDLYKKQYK